MNTPAATRPAPPSQTGGSARTAASREGIRYCEVTRDGVELSLLRFTGNVRRDPPVLLTHGTFSNAHVCRRLASFLADHGFDCWILG